jgi:hypothetical protein
MQHGFLCDPHTSKQYVFYLFSLAKKHGMEKLLLTPLMLNYTYLIHFFGPATQHRVAGFVTPKLLIRLKSNLGIGLGDPTIN